ncbi:MAG TPA: molybdopterin-dependent oxidoreductase [Gemmataceae bacterium]|nr:molybdopterin-dependent oxidoreductase [Gemmataceae bacterium]
MAVVYVNGSTVDIGNDRLNLIQAAQRGGVFVPHYCWHPALSVVASCRMCLVEVGDKKPDGSVAMQPKVVPGCQTPAKDGTVIVTNSDKAKAAQQQTLEGILLNHPLDCPVCDKAGECLLQDYSYNYGRASSRMIDEKNHPPNKPHIGEHITLFADRCIMCSRCVRFTREISGKGELEIINRGHHSEIDIFPGEPLNNKLAGNVVDLCPVGALCSKDFLYTQRVWFLKETKSVCPDCSTGCSITVDHNKDVVYRLRPRENPKAQGHFMCDDGRFDYPYINSRDRILQPLRRDGEVGETGWDKVLPALRKDLSEAVARDAAAVAFVFSPFLTCEEAYLLAKFARGLSPAVRLALGPVPMVGQDDTYPKDRRGNPTVKPLFTIRAEKCPNRRGVEAVLSHFKGESFQAIAQATESGELKALYLTAGYSPQVRDLPWYDQRQGAPLARVPLLIVQDLFGSKLSEVARYELPASSFAEKDGTFVNHANLAQEVHWAIRPHGSTKSDGQIFLDLLQRRGLIHAPTIRKELASEIAFFAPLSGELGDQGIVLG